MTIKGNCDSLSARRTPQPADAGAVLSVDQLARFIHKSPSSIRSDASRNPSALPPICRLPGNKRLLWRLIDVQEWLAMYVEKRPDVTTRSSLPTSLEPAQRQRGRPRKTMATIETRP